MQGKKSNDPLDSVLHKLDYTFIDLPEFIDGEAGHCLPSSRSSSAFRPLGLIRCSLLPQMTKNQSRSQFTRSLCTPSMPQGDTPPMSSNIISKAQAQQCLGPAGSSCSSLAKPSSRLRRFLV
jgi:hypothetical protein